MNDGRKIIATNPSCSQMIRVEYPRLLGTDEAKSSLPKPWTQWNSLPA